MIFSDRFRWWRMRLIGAGLAATFGPSTHASGQTTRPAGTMPEASKNGLTRLHRVYLSVHGMTWIDVTPDDPRHKDPHWEQFPGRCAMMHPLDFELRLRTYQIIDRLAPDEAVMILPDGLPANTRLVEYARSRLGRRAIVCEYDYDRKFLDSLGPDFRRGLQEDRRRAQEMRARGVTDEQFENEFAAWERSRAWAADLKRKMLAAGYDFDPATVDFVAWGGDWTGCAGTYPIQMGRAFGLAKPIERRWELITRDDGTLQVDAQLIVGNVPMPKNIRLFIYKSKQGRYYAEFWEGLHSPMDRAHTVTVEFPTGRVARVDLFGRPVGSERYGRITVDVGCGGHTPHRPGILEAAADLPLDDFHKALIAGKVLEKPLAKE